MKNVSIVFMAHLGPYAWEALPGGGDSVSRVLAFAESLPDCGKPVLFCRSGQDFAGQLIAGKYKCVEKENWTAENLVAAIREVCPEEGNVFFMFGDCPLLNREITDRMYTNHSKYLAQYTFADGYPAGMSPEIISHEILEAMQVLSKKVESAVDKSIMYDIIEKDINAFDIETEISPDDLRLYRVSLTADNKRNFAVVRAFIENGATDEPSIIKAVTEKEELLRSTPAYFSIQTNTGCPQKCAFCPWPLINPDLLEKNECMDPGKFGSILEKIASLAEDAVINLSLWGEPALHPQITELMQKTLEYSDFRLVMETSGLGWNSEILEKVLALDHKRISWIVSLETADKAVYDKLRGDGFAKANSFAEKLLAAHPASVYIQAVRMKESEEALEAFYRGWKEKTDNVIIQKYDHFCGFLPEKKVTDISPLNRMACWHVKRDLNILIDGRVVQCREDLKAENIYGNIFSDPIEKIWNNGQSLYNKHLKGDLPEICRKCDEYYTYNF